MEKQLSDIKVREHFMIGKSNFILLEKNAVVGIDHQGTSRNLYLCNPLDNEDVDFVYLLDSTTITEGAQPKIFSDDFIVIRDQQEYQRHFQSIGEVNGGWALASVVAGIALVVFFWFFDEGNGVRFILLAVMLILILAMLIVDRIVTQRYHRTKK